MKTVYHIGSGATQFPYDVDADNALRTHPAEWSTKPWSVEETNAWRRRQYEIDTDAASREGRSLPPPPAEVTISPERQTEINEDEKRRADAFKLVSEYDEKKRVEREYEDSVNAARALLATPRPAPEIPLVQGQPQGSALGPVDIPADWRDLSVPKRRSIAQRLGADITVKADEADKMIAAEVERRGEQRKAELTAGKAEQEQRHAVANTKPSATFEQPNPKPPKA